MLRRALPVALAGAVLLAGCGRPSAYLYDRSATLACLEQSPEYVKELDFAPNAPIQIHAQSVTYRRATELAGVPIAEGTPAISVSFNDESFSHVEAIVFPDEPAAQRVSRAALNYVLDLRQDLYWDEDLAPSKLIERHRNVVLLWSGPYASEQLRRIVPACLRTAP